MTTFTQGPWHCGQGNGEGSIFADNGGRMTFSKKGTALHPICLMANSFEENEDRANARLIAAAPELLEALKAIYEIDVPDAEWSPTLEKCFGVALDAIAKVEGEK